MRAGGWAFCKRNRGLSTKLLGGMDEKLGKNEDPVGLVVRGGWGGQLRARGLVVWAFRAVIMGEGNAARGGSAG